MSDENIPPLLTPEQVAFILAMCLSTFKKNCSVRPDSVPPFLKIGNAPNSPIRFRRTDVEKWIEAQFDANNSTSDFQSLLNKAEAKI